MKELIRKTGNLGAYAVALFLLLCLLLGLVKYTLPQSPIVLLFSAVMFVALWYVRKTGKSVSINNGQFWTVVAVLLVLTFCVEAYILNYMPFEWATDPKLC